MKVCHPNLHVPETVWSKHGRHLAMSRHIHHQSWQLTDLTLIVSLVYNVNCLIHCFWLRQELKGCLCLFVSPAQIFKLLSQLSLISLSASLEWSSSDRSIVNRELCKYKYEYFLDHSWWKPFLTPIIITKVKRLSWILKISRKSLVSVPIAALCRPASCLVQTQTESDLSAHAYSWAQSMQLQQSST